MGLDMYLTKAKTLVGEQKILGDQYLARKELFQGISDEWYQVSLKNLLSVYNQTVDYLEKNFEYNSPEYNQRHTIVSEMSKILGLDNTFQYYNQQIELYGELYNKLQERDIEFGYWRKFYPLDEYFANIYQERISAEKEFNCEDLPLTKKDCEDVITFCKEQLKELEDPSNSDNDKDYYIKSYNYTITLFEKAISLYDEGYYVIYSCWF